MAGAAVLKGVGPLPQRRTCIRTYNRGIRHDLPTLTSAMVIMMNSSITNSTITNSSSRTSRTGGRQCPLGIVAAAAAANAL